MEIMRFGDGLEDSWKCSDYLEVIQEEIKSTGFCCIEKPNTALEPVVYFEMYNVEGEQQ